MCQEMSSLYLLLSFQKGRCHPHCHSAQTLHCLLLNPLATTSTDSFITSQILPQIFSHGTPTFATTILALNSPNLFFDFSAHSFSIGVIIIIFPNYQPHYKPSHLRSLVR